MAGYTRQSASGMLPDLPILAEDMNAEFNTLEASMNAVTGHAHTGEVGEGAPIDLDAATVGILPIEKGGTGTDTVEDILVILDLDEVDNTSDLDKPISTATQAAFDSIVLDVEDVIAGKADNTITITGGNGLTGGGNLTANRTITMGTPGTTTFTSTNAVTTDSHTHALTLTSANLNSIYGYTPVNPTRNLVAGDGLTGGGTLAADRTFTLGTPGTITGSSSNAVTATSHTHALTLVSGNITGALGFTPADASISILAGNGLSGGGTLAASRTLTLGTPGTITVSTTNAVTTTSHTHALTLSAANLNSIYGYTPVTSARVVTAGNGLTGGGALSGNISLALVGPGSVTNSSTNTVTTNGHTHALGFTAAEVYTGSAANNTSFGVGHSVLVSTSGLLQRNQAATIRLSESVALYVVDGAGSILAGTWRARGGASFGTFGSVHLVQRTA